MREDSTSKMDKKSAIRRAKRQAKVEENYWDCSVCTYRNTAEAFKCLMCDVRKGTSTRKPRINPAMAAAQAGNSGAANGTPERRKSESRRGQRHRLQRKRPRRPPRLTDVDRSSAQTREVTVNSVTVIITEYKPKKSPLSSEPEAGERERA